MVSIVSKDLHSDEKMLDKKDLSFIENNKNIENIEKARTFELFDEFELYFA